MKILYAANNILIHPYKIKRYVEQCKVLMENLLKKFHSSDSPKEHRRQFIELCSKFNSLDIKTLRKAFYFCYFFHRKDYRKDKTKYYLHPLHSAYYLIHIFKFDETNSTVACLLHDCIEEANLETTKEYRKNLILKEFGEDVLNLVLQVTKIKTKKNVESESFATLMLAMIKDIRVILIKLSDRLHNLYTLKGHKLEKRKEIAEETLKFFVPIAQWLGIRAIKQIIEEICFENFDAKYYKEINKYRAKMQQEFAMYIKNLENNVRNKLEYHNFKAVITCEHKTNYELYELSLRENKKFNQIDNFFSMVITLENENEDPILNCYRAWGVINKYFTVIEEKDYIRNPKFNKFQSIITYIYNEDGRIIEILIRSEEMDNIARNGTLEEIKKYKRFKTLDLTDNDIDLLNDWINELILKKGENARFIIWDLMRINFYSQEINVFTKGKMYKLPKDTALINLSFLIDGVKGFYLDFNQTTVNKKPAFYNTKLNDKDTIELVYSNTPTVLKDWISQLTLFKPISIFHNYIKNNMNIEKIE